MIEAGIQKFLAKELAWCVNSNKGTRYVGVVGECFNKGGESVGEIAGELYWTDATKERTIKALKAMGWSGKFKADGSFEGPFKVTDACIKNDEWPVGSGTFKLKLDWVGEPPFAASLRANERLKLHEAKQLQNEVLAAMGMATQPQF